MTGMPKWGLFCGRDSEDPEKAVLPAIIWTRDEVFGGWCLTFGWWDWSIRLLRYGTS